MTAAGFPHSGISGSQLTCSSPKLFAAYRALPRLSVPRHPPCALISLDRICSLALVRDEAHRSTYCLHTLVLESRLPLDFLLPIPNTRIFKQNFVAAQSAAEPSNLTDSVAVVNGFRRRFSWSALRRSFREGHST